MPQLTHSDDYAGPARPAAAHPDSRLALDSPAGVSDLPDPGAGSARDTATPDLDELRLAAEQAEAEAVAAEAVAAAAQARARAGRLRQRAVAAEHAVTRVAEADAAVSAVSATAPEPPAAPADPPSDDSAPAAGSAPVAQEATDPAATAEPAPAKAVPAATTAGDAATSPAPSRRSRRLPSGRALIGALAVASIAVSGTVSGMLVHHHRETMQSNQRKVEFTEAARQGVVALTSLDFSRAEQDVQRVLEHSTGAFRDDFESRSQDFTSVIEQSRVATAGTVNSAAVESMTEDSAVVLVAATSQVTNSAGAQEEPRAWRLSVTVTREGDTIKMSKVEFVP
ncbi:hypothetical protein [Nocardia higoensis]|uniref:hypothetical protein n=1 Tax=Nocardia higoensis TaxID=228599 RepID=UPI001FE0E520|nr:hypothetical protein [Nocardia higoensis]